MAIGIERTTEEYENDTAIVLEGSYPLWGFNYGEVKEARADQQIQELKLTSLKKEVRFEVYKAYLEAELADKQVQINQKSLEESNELLRQITTQYQEGKLSFVLYLDNVKTIKQARVSYYEALKNYMVSIAELENSIQATPFPVKEEE